MEFDTWLERYYFKKYILDVAIATLEQGGVTSNITTYQFFPSIDAGGLPKYPGKTLILAPEADIASGLVQFIADNAHYLRELDTWLGTWINPRTRCCHLDITAIYPSLDDAKQEALRRGYHEGRNVVALYNFKHGQTVFLEHEQTLSSL